MPTAVAASEIKPDGALPAGTWRVVEIDTIRTIEDIEVTVEISDDGGLSGNGGCNSFAGTIARSGDGVTISGVSATRRFCLGPIMEQESALFSLLEKVDAIAVDAETLLMRGNDDLLIKGVKH